MYHVKVNEKIRKLSENITNLQHVTPETLQALISSELQTVLNDAEMFNALLNQQRIRVLGHAKLGEEEYQHIGVEMWTRHLGCEEQKVKESTQYGRDVLKTYLSTHARAIRNRNIEIDNG